MPGFEKTAAEKTDVDDIIEISDIEKKDDSTIVLMKRTLISFKHKMLSLIVLKLLKCIQIINCRAQDLKMLRQSLNLNKYNLNIIQTARKELNKIAEFTNMISAVKNTVINNHFFKLLSEMYFSDLVNKKLSADVAF
ncbi:hypothetical protein BDDG_11816 [Blastomyces dermatitidis ATCC 18188]|uniref:Uncharacterized protein n=1 Tax=Ajellomyces dermatitidis (strain ATCC 18188 / CBS 674.68) TaxID=653446 RepID=A0A0J9ELH9_AJEDA|nr:hypothetical protein BDDG_11816 [Blastomyces dermatitidis ATCC 18188]